MIFATPIIQILKDKPVEFPKLFVEDYEALFDVQRAFKKAKIEKNLKDGMISKEEAKQFMLALADSSDNIFEVQNSFADPKMLRAILEKSWAKTGKPANELTALLKEEDPDLLAGIAYRVCHKGVEKVEEATGTAPKSEAGN